MVFDVRKMFSLLRPLHTPGIGVSTVFDGERIPESARLILFCCCDQVYYDRYVFPLLLSVDRHSPGVHIHVHVVNPSPVLKKGFERMGEMLLHTSTTLSTEVYDFKGMSQEFRRTYYASVRFVRLAELCKARMVPVLAIDVDAVVMRSVLSIRKAARDGDVSLRLRLHRSEAHLKTAAGAVYLAPTAGARKFISRVAQRIETSLHQALSDPTASPWYIDQVALTEAYETLQDDVTFINMPKSYCDWDMRDGSAVWTAKGDLKTNSEKFLDIQDRILKRLPIARAELVDKCPERKLKWGIFLPKLDIQWKEPAIGTQPRLVDADSDTARLRLYWRQFADILAQTLVQHGEVAEIIELPAWEITRERVEVSNHDVALVPHQCLEQFGEGEKPCFFYMQVFCQWLFTVDRLGWSAASSRYPCAVSQQTYHDNGLVALYRQALLGVNGSKFSQPSSQSRESLVCGGQIPEGGYVLFPCQIPHDLAVTQFSDVDVLQLVKNLVRWANKRKISLVVKPHPANPKAMQSIKPLLKGKSVYWADQASVHDLIEHSDAIFTINSGVGFEAMLHGKPVVAFGRVDYDAAVIRGGWKTMNELDAAWRNAQALPPQVIQDRYGRFLSWFTREYAVDLALDADLGGRFRRLVIELRNQVNEGQV